MKLFYTLSIIILTLPTVLFAQESVYAPLVDLSNAGQGNQVQTFEQYINFLYGMSIAVAALLAVIKIVIAGAKYMLSDVINTKGEALSDIQGAILGLLLILSAVIILELINPQLIEKEITFPEFQSPRGAVLAPAVQAVAGANGTAGDVVVSDRNLNLIPKEEFPPSEYKNILASFTTLTGNVRIAKPSEYCKKDAESFASYGTIDTAYEKCMGDVENSMNDYCLHNAGIFKKTNKDTIFSCELPTDSRKVADFQSAFENYKLNMPQTSQEEISRALKVKTMDSPDEEIFKILCEQAAKKETKGAFKDLKLTSAFGVDDYRCVWYI